MNTLRNLITNLNFEPLTLEHLDSLKPYLSRVKSGISEFSFAGLYLFRSTYNYKVGFLDDLLLVCGQKAEKTFCLVPVGLPNWDQIKLLLGEFDYIKNLSEEQVRFLQLDTRAEGFEIVADRDNWDYIYDTREMAELGGKRFHKKRNLVHQFYHQYSTLDMEKLNESNVAAAQQILKLWTSHHPENNDYVAASEALKLFRLLNLDGAVFFVENQPVAYTLGEKSSLQGDYIIHFEKADFSFKGVYQAIFQRFAQSLIDTYPRINREQDLGDEGLRQSKETYRPVDFIKKYRVYRLE